jgi:hypothetical protein
MVLYHVFGHYGSKMVAVFMLWEPILSAMLFCNITVIRNTHLLAKNLFEMKHFMQEIAISLASLTS